MLFVDLETRLLEMIDYPGGELLARIVRRVFRQEPSHQATTAADRTSDREGELIAERVMIHVGDFSLCSEAPNRR